MKPTTTNNQRARSPYQKPHWNKNSATQDGGRQPRSNSGRPYSDRPARMNSSFDRPRNFKRPFPQTREPIPHTQQDHGHGEKGSDQGTSFPPRRQGYGRDTQGFAPRSAPSGRTANWDRGRSSYKKPHWEKNTTTQDDAREPHSSPGKPYSDRPARMNSSFDRPRNFKRPFPQTREPIPHTQQDHGHGEKGSDQGTSFPPRRQGYGRDTQGFAPRNAPSGRTANWDRGRSSYKKPHWEKNTTTQDGAREPHSSPGKPYSDRPARMNSSFDRPRNFKRPFPQTREPIPHTQLDQAPGERGANQEASLNTQKEGYRRDTRGFVPRSAPRRRTINGDGGRSPYQKPHWEKSTTTQDGSNPRENNRPYSDRRPRTAGFGRPYSDRPARMNSSFDRPRDFKRPFPQTREPILYTQQDQAPGERGANQEASPHTQREGYSRDTRGFVPRSAPRGGMRARQMDNNRNKSSYQGPHWGSNTALQDGSNPGRSEGRRPYSDQRQRTTPRFEDAREFKRPFSQKAEHMPHSHQGQMNSERTQGGTLTIRRDGYSCEKQTFVPSSSLSESITPNTMDDQKSISHSQELQLGENATIQDGSNQSTSKKRRHNSERQPRITSRSEENRKFKPIFQQITEPLHAPEQDQVHADSAEDHDSFTAQEEMSTVVMD